jgi:hypothetical protein
MQIEQRQQGFEMVQGDLSDRPECGLSWNKADTIANTCLTQRREDNLMPSLKKVSSRRLRLPGWIRGRLRGLFFRMFNKVVATDDYRTITALALSGLLPCKSELWHGLTGLPEPGYAELGRVPTQSSAASRAAPVFITARFRSGSTMLWNLFRNVAGCTAYYEPLSHTRYFDTRLPTPSLDPTHRGVQDYRAEYTGLEELSQLYQAQWARRNFLMGEDFWQPDLKRFIEVMIEKAKGYAVLQFNRIDFRLPWIRMHFPHARLIHLYRHPRDQWCSTLQDNSHRPKNETVEQRSIPDRFYLSRNGTFEQFARHDNYYLRIWANDLRHHFPFLDESRLSHPYELFYFIWKLSYLFGRKYCDHSVAYEDLLSNPELELQKLMTAAGIKTFDLNKLRSLLVEPSLNKWKKFADDAWFRKHEEYCETVLEAFLGNESVMKYHQGRGAVTTVTSSSVGTVERHATPGVVSRWRTV